MHWFRSWCSTENDCTRDLVYHFWKSITHLPLLPTGIFLDVCTAQSVIEYKASPDSLSLSIMNTPDTISLLRTLSKTISDGVDKIDQSCTRLQLKFPSLDEPFTPANQSHLDPQISEAVSIIVAAAAQITAIVRPAPVSLLTSAAQVCGLLVLWEINWSYTCWFVVWCSRSNSYCYCDKYSGDTARSRSTGSLSFSALPLFF